MFTLLCSISFILSYTRLFLPWHEKRPFGVVLNDPIHNILPSSWDVSIPVSILQALGSFLGFIDILYFRGFEGFELLWLQFAICLSLKAVCLFVTNLNAPKNTVPLRDVIVEYFGKSEKPLERDLFFSGHTAWLLFLILNSSSLIMKVTESFILLGISSLLMIGRVHYTIDIIMAWFVCFQIHHVV